METKYGKRIFTKINRPDRALADGFARIPTSNINDMMNRMFNMTGGLKCFTKGASMVGTAVTVHCCEGDNGLLHRAMDLAQPGDVIVINDGGCTSRALCGEVMFTYSKGKGIAGFVIDGSIRDVDSLNHLGFPVYAKSVTPQGPWKKGTGEINVPIACCGQVVCPGDIIVGDEDGIVVIPPAWAKEVLAAARDKYETEQVQLTDYRSGRFDYEEHAAVYEKLMEAGGMVTYDEVCHR